MLSPVAVVLLVVWLLTLPAAAVFWARAVVGSLRWFLRELSALSGHGAPSPDSQPKVGPGSVSHPKGAKRPPQGVDGRGGVDYPARHYLLDVGGLAVFAVAIDPDFESFFGGFATAVAAGGILLTAVVVVMVVRRFTSF